MRWLRIAYLFLTPYLFTCSFCAYSNESWPQYKYDCWHSGNVPNRSVTTPLGLIGAVPLTDAIFTAPVVADGRVYVVDQFFRKVDVFRPADLPENAGYLGGEFQKKHGEM